MKTITLWFLVTTSYYGEVQYSPPMLEVSECKRVQAVVTSHQYMRNSSATCVQLSVVKP